MKKKNEEKKQKILKVIKIIGCSLGLFLCGGAFIGLLFVGVRGCVSQNNKKVDNDTTLTTINHKKVVKYDALKTDDINGVAYYPYVLGGYNMFGHYPPKIDITGTTEISIDTYINGLKRSYFSIAVSSLGGLVRNGYGFYNYDENNLQTDYIELNYVFTGNTPMETFSNGIKAGDFIYFQSERFDYLKSQNVSYFNNLFSSYVLRPYENVDITFNNVINPFGPYGVNFDFFINSQLSGTKILFKGLFKDLTGTIYKRIELSYLSAQGMRYGTITDYQTYTLDGSHYMLMAYYTLDDTQIIVNAQDYGTATSGNQEGNVVMLKSNHFISNLFQNINIMTIENDDNYISPTFDRLVALTSLNNSNTGTAIYSGGGSIGGTNPFVLIGNAFASLMPFLNITIIPGLTIGTLLLVPLVGMIVLFVVFLFKR